MSGILSSIIFIFALLNLLKSTGRGTNLYTLFFKLLNLFDQMFNFSISNLSTSVFRLAKFDFNAKLKLST